MLEEYLNKLFNDRNFNFVGTKIDYIKEDEKFYVVYLDEKIESVGRQLIYKINKETGEHDEIYLPDIDNFEFLDRFENCNFVQIPKKYLGKYFDKKYFN